MQIQEQLRVKFEQGVEVAVDLNQVKMNDKQRAIMNKLIRKIDNLETMECTKEGGCPAQKHLSAEEFNAIRSLSATLTPARGGITVAGPFIDFCLHVINVHSNAVGPGEL